MLLSSVVCAQDKSPDKPHDKDKCECVAFWLDNKAFNFPPIPSDAIFTGCDSWTDYNHLVRFSVDWNFKGTWSKRYGLLATFDRLGTYSCVAVSYKTPSISTEDATFDGIDGQLDFYRNPQEAANACAKYINTMMKNRDCRLQKERK